MFVQKVLQRLLFQFHVRYMLIIVRLLGICPFYIDEKAKTIRTTWYLKLYPLAVIMCFVMSVVLSPPSLHVGDKIWRSDAANLLIFLYGTFFAISFLSIYIVQHLKFKSIRALTERCHQLFTLRISKYFVIKDFSYVKLLLLYTFKSKILMIFLAYCIVIRMYLMSSFAWFAIVAYFGTNYVILIVPNLFIATVLMAYFLFRQINSRVKRILHRAIALSAAGAKLKKPFRMQRFCELSDRLDEIAILHLELCKFVNAVNAVTSFHVTNYITLKFMSLQLQLFFSYMYASVLIQQEAEDGKQLYIILIVTGIQTAILNVVELTFLIHTFQMMVAEVTLHIV